MNEKRGKEATREEGGRKKYKPNKQNEFNCAHKNVQKKKKEKELLKRQNAADGLGTRDKKMSDNEKNE